MKKLLSLAALSLIALSAQHSNAGILIEPYLGYETGKYDNSGTTSSPKGVTLGARAGLTTLGFMYGLEFSKGAIKDTLIFSATDMGAFVGFEFPILLRVYASYMFDSKMTLEATGSSDTEYTGSGGTKIGIGYTGLPFFAINFEMISRKYDKAKILGVSSDTTAKMDTTMISLSLPLP